MAGWADHRELVRLELIQSAEEGKDPEDISRLRTEWEQAGEDKALLEAIHQELLDLPVCEDFPFQEPDELSAIRALRPSAQQVLDSTLDDTALLDKLHGAWLGRCVGCALGKPVERFMAAGSDLLSWQRQKRFLTAVSPEEWPLRDYFPQHSPAEEETGRTGSPLSTREEISFMESDDDIRYTIIGQIVLKEWGMDFLPVHVARAWMDWLGYSRVCTAETAAYRNLVIGYDINRFVWFSHERSRTAQEGIDWHWVACHMNPYREWIGAQIRVDSYGYAVPGKPQLAAEMAWRDASISHCKNGLYGAMYTAAMIAAAFCTDDVHKIVQAGLEQIPANCRLGKALCETIGFCESVNHDPARFEEVIEWLYVQFNHYHPVHTINNATLCTAALLLSEGDFARGITLAVMGGWDTDCNGATLGSIVGAINGARKAPEFWTARLNDRIESLIAGYHPVPISECARRSLEIARRLD